MRLGKLPTKKEHKERCTLYALLNIARLSLMNHSYLYALCLALFAMAIMISAELCGDTGMHTPEGMMCFENGFAQNNLQDSVKEQAVLARLLINCKALKEPDDEQRKICADSFRRAGYAREHFIQLNNGKIGSPIRMDGDHRENLEGFYAWSLYTMEGLGHATEARKELEEAHRIYVARRTALNEAPGSVIDIIMD